MSEGKGKSARKEKRRVMKEIRKKWVQKIMRAIIGNSYIV